MTSATDGIELARARAADVGLRVSVELSREGSDPATVERIATRAGLSVVSGSAAAPSGMMLDRAGNCVAVFTHSSARIDTLEVTLVTWTRHDATEYSSPREFGAARDEFHQAYLREVERCRMLLGPPSVDGRDADERGFSYAAWYGPAALVAVAETDVDPQSGERVVLWTDFRKRQLPEELPGPFGAWANGDDLADPRSPGRARR